MRPFPVRATVASATWVFLAGMASTAFAQTPPPWCVPGTPLCARGNGNGGATIGGSAQGQAGPNGVSGSATGNANGNADGNANANAGDGGSYEGDGSGDAAPRRYSRPVRFGSGTMFCATAKLGVFSGLKGGGCLAVSFRWEGFFFEMETQVLAGGVRHSIDWIFPLSFVVPLTSRDRLYEGLQLRSGGAPVGVTFAKKVDGGTYARFELFAGLSYEWDLGDVAWRVFDARAFLDFGTKREVDLRGNFLDFGVQLGTGIVL